MALLKATVVMAHVSGLAEDTASNSFYFGTPPEGSTAAGLDQVKTDLLSFYNGLPAAAEWPAKYLSPVINTAQTKLKIYNMSDPKPRPPIYDVPFALLTAAGTPLPSEVAICMSFQAVQIAGIPQARRRGRIFLGPLKTSVLEGTPARPHSAAIPTLVAAMKRLRDESALAGHYQWMVLSGLDAALAPPTAPVHNGWVDNAFDTQRRRGEKATLREVWTTV